MSAAMLEAQKIADEARDKAFELIESRKCKGHPIVVSWLVEEVLTMPRPILKVENRKLRNTWARVRERQNGETWEDYIKSLSDKELDLVGHLSMSEPDALVVAHEFKKRLDDCQREVDEMLEGMIRLSRRRLGHD